MTVHDALPAEPAQQIGSDAFTIEGSKGVTVRQPHPALPPLPKVVTGKHPTDRIVDLLGRVAPREILGGIGVQQQVSTGQDDRVKVAEPCDVLLSEAQLVVDLAAVEHPAPGEISPAAKV